MDVIVSGDSVNSMAVGYLKKQIVLRMTLKNVFIK